MSEAEASDPQDRDEGDFGWPVVSLSLGDEGLFRMGGVERSDGTESLWLRSGDAATCTLGALSRTPRSRRRSRSVTADSPRCQRPWCPPIGWEAPLDGSYYKLGSAAT